MDQEEPLNDKGYDDDSSYDREDNYPSCAHNFFLSLL